METELIEKNILIARRQAPGDNWYLVSDKLGGDIYKSLTAVLEAYMTKTGFKGEYKLAPLKSELYAIESEENEIKEEPPKRYSLYGEY